MVGVKQSRSDSEDASKEELEARYRINVNPGRTTYREAVLVFSGHPSVPADDPEHKKVCLLADKDHEFYRQLQDDEHFRAMFCRRIIEGHTWTPGSRIEELARDTIDKAITNRIELVLAQKVLLGKYFHLLGDEDKERLCRQVDDEISYSEQWINEDMPNYKNLHFKFVTIRSLDFLADNHDQSNPTRPYNFED